MTSRDVPLDAETLVAEPAGDHAAELRLWLRLLTCTNLIEGEIRGRLRERFGITLPRFDLMAQLERAPDGLTLSELSQRMMVSNGNLTALVERLVGSGHLDKRTSQRDRRAQVIRLTAKGRSEFARFAAEHGDWIGTLLQGCSEAEMATLMRLLTKVKTSVREAIEREARE